MCMAMRSGSYRASSCCTRRSTQTKVFFYFLDDLDPSTSYELRISYPATMPTDFEMVIIDRPKEVPSNPTRRRLLNTERIRIDPPDTQISAGSQRHQCWVRVTARHTGVSFRPELQNPPVVYNIVVASLILGVPTDALGLVGVAVVGLVVVGWLGVPWFLDFLDRDPEAETPQEKND
eukprot:comp20673_c0_seq1/m.26846 comp20673_c0_seq1/g.26846  ORF comp20673_c0_seq1/g.26846 comp20673_c0_seq1/m.26846 type:complete len:177 (-) comp20673_c0_seq1:105-635(-)